MAAATQHTAFPGSAPGQTERPWFIYVLKDPRTDEVRYVGYSFDVEKRAKRHVHDAIRPHGTLTYKEKWILALKDVGLSPALDILETGIDLSEREDSEVRWIAHYRSLGVRLANATDGGGGCTGYVASEEARAKISQTKTGRTASSAELLHIAKLADRRRGERMSPKSVERMRIAQRGKKMSPDAIAKSATAHRGAKRSEETCAKIRVAKQYTSDATRLKMSISHKGKAVSPETIAKIVAKTRGRKVTFSASNLANLRAALCGRVVSRETRAMLSKARKGMKLPPEWAAKCARNLSKYRGRPSSDATKEKLRIINTGKVIPPETRKKISEGLARYRAGVSARVSSGESST